MKRVGLPRRGMPANLGALVAIGLVIGASVARADHAAPAAKPTPAAASVPTPQVSVADARKLFPSAPKSCADIACMIEDAYADDAKAKAAALALYGELGHVAGVGPEEIMDGGYRGKIHLVPQLPTGKYRRHIEWVVAAKKSIDAFFVQLFDGHPTAPAYRWRGLSLRFVRSVKKRTPSAYAFGWVIEYNVLGSLMTSETGVRETLFHELFHNNDSDHRDWSAAALQADYAAIVKKCGTKVRCLAPYAPNTTKVRGGTYYAFQQNNGNGVHEYAAEIAVRYWKEQTEMMRNKKLAKQAFKCGPAENARSWQKVVDEFFAGRDLTPPC